MKKFPPPRFQTGPLNHCNSLSGNRDNSHLQMSARFPRSSGGERGGWPECVANRKVGHTSGGIKRHQTFLVREER
jgi:hypothetical protein